VWQTVAHEIYRAAQRPALPDATIYRIVCSHETWHDCHVAGKETDMKFAASLLALVVVVVTIRSISVSQSAPASVGPKFTADGSLVFPENYREWVWLSSGLGMTYGPNATPPQNPIFDNVFVTPEAYRSFLRTGNWPDQTMFVLELRSSQSEGSINKGGRFQGGVRAVEVEVKDEKRFPGKWGFFDFPAGSSVAKKLPESASCYSCHAQNGAVDNTFVQFYPTLVEIAKAKGVYKLR
jgi:hypothetical protein